MENSLVFSPTAYSLIANFFALALSAHLVGFLYFLAVRERIAPRYRMATVFSMLVMASSGLLFARLAMSWNSAFVFDGEVFVRGQDRFDNGLRYVNWFITVPLLLAQVLYAFDLARERVLRLRVALVASGLLMILPGYVGQFSEPTTRDPGIGALLFWGTVSTVPFLVLVALMLRTMTAGRADLPPEAATTMRNMTFVLVFSWGLYPIAYLVPAFSVTAEAAVLKQALFTAADIGSKVLWGVMLSKVLRLRSAADGWEPALAAAEGAVGRAPERESYDGQRAERPSRPSRPGSRRR